jgi:hypothetical protein
MLCVEGQISVCDRMFSNVTTTIQFLCLAFKLLASEDVCSDKVDLRVTVLSSLGRRGTNDLNQLVNQPIFNQRLAHLEPSRDDC